MRLLILGGTWFLGRALGVLALDAGWSVTTFNRGISAADLPGVQAVRGDRERPEDLIRLADYGPWDAVIDTIGYVPRQVLATATTLAPAAGRYIFVSSVNVYTGWPDKPLDDTSPIFECPADADADFGADLGYAGQYGALKAGCERAVVEAFGAGRATILRPGVILGPHEYVGRLTWWLARAARGGQLLVPGPSDRPIQPIDARDVSAFALGCASNGHAGSFNLAAPIGHATFADLVNTCVAVTAAGTEPVWADPVWLVRQGVQQWTELPLWRTHEGVWKVDSSRAEHAGLPSRPLPQTVAETWEWMNGGGTAITGTGEAGRVADHGLAAEREQTLLQAWIRRD
ncbi:NAD-dependent epimerase/dehydratase family protein [Phytohabitans flavus]|uniref:Reductase n=1 Tax=Phytohabitans flavus TaxID=1076124 RepID=A0A6F8XL60_9ACTN|nr:NAD-dependent epimerase/dehydratase family protein [Phytohabitans flavus]BCB74543.1 reductase [Phytohabitans flavus]